MTRLLLALLIAALLPLGLAAPARAQPAPGGRMALVVAAADYRALPPLPGVPAEAAQVAARLEALGYSLTTLADPDRAAFDVALAVFARQAEAAEAALVYVAGHALASGGATRLALVDSRIATPDEAPGQTFPLEALLARLARPGRPAVVLIDARTEALPAALAGALVPPPAAEATLVALAEGGAAGTSLFARALAEALATAEAGRPSVQQALADIAARLEAEGKGRLRLTLASTLAAPLPLAPAAPPGPGPAGLPIPVFPRPPAADAGPPAPEAPPVFVIPRFDAAPGAQPEPEPEPEPETVVVVIPEDLPRAIQQELARVGCYTQRVDGVWGRGSRAALAEFARATDRRGLGDQPTPEVWEAVRGATGTVCRPAPADPAAAIRGRTHAAIAFSRATYIAPEGAANGWGVSSNRPSAQQAAAAAIRDCTGGDPVVTDCRVVLGFSGGCGALAVGGTGMSVAPGVGRGTTQAAATAAALADCRRRAGGCRAVAAVCTP